MELVFSAVFLCLSFLSFMYLNRKDYNKALLLLLFLITFSPMMQYVVFPEYKRYDAMGIRFLGVQRIWVEFIVTIILLLVKNKLPIPTIKINKGFYIVLSLFFLLNLTQFFYCQDFNRAFSGFWMSVVNPIIYVTIVDRLIRSSVVRVYDMMSLFYKYGMFLLAGFYFFSFMNVTRGVAVDDDSEALHLFGLGYGLGLFQHRIVMTAIFTFLPIMMLPRETLYKAGIKHINIFIALVFLTLIFCNSRTMYLGSLLMYVLVATFNPFKNRKSYVKLLLLLAFSVFLIDIFTHSSIFEDVIAVRFHNKGDTAYSSAMEDERFLIWDFAVQEAHNSHYLGMGIGNFALSYVKHFSNAHSLYYSVLAERGILVLICTIYVILYNIVKGWIVSKRINNDFFKVLSIGTFCYAIIAYTGEELFNCAQVAYSIMPYLLFIIYCTITNYKHLKYE